MGDPHRAVAGTRFCDFEHGSAIIGPAIGCCAEEIAGRVDDQGSERVGAIGAVEGRQRRYGAEARTIPCDFEHGADAISAAAFCWAKEIARRVGDQASARVRAVEPIEIRQRRDGAVARAVPDDFEHRAVAIGAGFSRRGSRRSDGSRTIKRAATPRSMVARLPRDFKALSRSRRDAR
jgi:hypothetical protein